MEREILSSYRLTVPAEIRDELDLSEHDWVLIKIRGDDGTYLTYRRVSHRLVTIDRVTVNEAGLEVGETYDVEFEPLPGFISDD